MRNRARALRVRLLQGQARQQGGEAQRPTSTPYAGDLSIFEYPDRDKKLEINRVMTLLGIAPGKTVADIGAGSGWFTVRAARRVGAGGAVLAEDINPAAIQYMDERAHKENLGNVHTVLGTADDAKLPAGSVDAVLLLKVYHEIARPVPFMSGLRVALKPGAKVGIIDRNGDGSGTDQLPVQSGWFLFQSSPMNAACEPTRPLRSMITTPSPGITRSFGSGRGMVLPSRRLTATIRNAPSAWCSISPMVSPRVATGGGHRDDHEIQSEVVQVVAEPLHLLGAADHVGTVGVQDHFRDAFRADVRGQHDLVGAGMQQLAFGGRRLAARDDGEGLVETARAQRDEHVGRIVGQDGRQKPRPRDAASFSVCSSVASPWMHR